MTAIAILSAGAVLLPAGFMTILIGIAVSWAGSLDESDELDLSAEMSGSISERSGIE